MKKLIAAAAALLLAAPLQAQVLTFEDIPSAADFGSIDAGYTPYSPLGLSFTGWCFTTGVYPAVSGTYSLYNSDGCNAGSAYSFAPQITSASTFGVSSVWLGYYNTPSVTFNGYLNGNLVATQAAAVGSFAQVFFGSAFSNIDTFEMTLGQDTYAFIDDLDVTPTSTVPEPSSLLFIGAGLSALVAVRRRNRRVDA